MAFLIGGRGGFLSGGAATAIASGAASTPAPTATVSGGTLTVGRMVFARVTFTLAALSTTIAPRSSFMGLIPGIPGNGGTLTSIPHVSPGEVDGQELELTMDSAAGTFFTFTDQGTLAGSGMRLAASTRTVGPRDYLRLRWDAREAIWVERGHGAVL